MNTAAENAEGRAGVAAFQQVLQQFGWSQDRNVQIETRWGANDVDLASRYAAELIALAPDVVLASGTLSVAALQRRTRTIPVDSLNCLSRNYIGSGAPIEGYSSTRSNSRAKRRGRITEYSSTTQILQSHYV